LFVCFLPQVQKFEQLALNESTYLEAADGELKNPATVFSLC